MYNFDHYINFNFNLTLIRLEFVLFKLILKISKTINKNFKLLLKNFIK